MTCSVIVWYNNTSLWANLSLSTENKGDRTVVLLYSLTKVYFDNFTQNLDQSSKFLSSSTSSKVLFSRLFFVCSTIMETNENTMDLFMTACCSGILLYTLNSEI